MRFAVKSFVRRLPTVTSTPGSAASQTSLRLSVFYFLTVVPWTPPAPDASPAQEAASPLPPAHLHHRPQPPQQLHRQYPVVTHRHLHPTASSSATRKILLSPAAWSVDLVRSFYQLNIRALFTLCLQNKLNIFRGSWFKWWKSSM